MTAKTIAENFEISGVAVLKHIKILVEHGLVGDTESDPRQKSKQRYVITPKGARLSAMSERCVFSLAQRSGGSAA